MMGKVGKRKGARVSQKAWARWATRMGLIASAFILAPLAGDDVSAQEDPTSIGAGQRPYIVLLVDSSASMEFSLDGEQAYACYQRQPNGPGLDSCRDSNPQDPQDPFSNSNAIAPPEDNTGNASYFAWRAEYPLGDVDASRASELDRDYEDPETGPTFVGPCYVWKDECEDYSRPPWYPDLLDDHKSNNDEDEYDDRMWERLTNMRGIADSSDNVNPDYAAGTAVRLTDENQPRHVQLKEILTGDMILKPATGASGNALGDFNANATIHGPGCWFVPRMSNLRTAKDHYHICSEVDASGNKTGTFYGNHDNAFHKLVDYNDPRPHFQEVFDFQLSTGLMDNLANVAIFSVAMFDGYSGVLDPGDGLVKPENDPDNNGVDKQPIINDGVITTNPDGAGSDIYLPNGLPSESSTTYDLGVYKIVGPNRLDLPSSQLNALSSYSQYAVVDAGYMRNGGKKEWTINPEKNESNLPYNFPDGLERYAQPYQMGHQPISGATPLAGAMRDIHMFMMNGQAEFDKHGVAETPNQGQWDPINSDDDHKDLNNDGKSYIVNPVQADPYKRCRPKHVVMLTDGFPQPERPDDLNPHPDGPLFVGSGQLNDAFGYVDWPNRYVYDTAENEIAAFVNNSNLNDVEGNSEAFLPRVHIVGLNLADATLETANGDPGIVDVHEKLGRMAQAGNTCALAQLAVGTGIRYVPLGWNVTVDGNTYSGQCDPSAPVSPSNAGNCLVQQLPAGSYMYRGETDCIAPAILLEQNDRFQSGNATDGRPFRDDLTEAIQLVFNEVISSAGGVASRTRAAITNTLDDVNVRGQYRVFSGVDVSGGNVFWEGVLERQTIACAQAGGAIAGSNQITSLHNEIDLQVREDSSSPTNYTDNRRVFTSIALGIDADSNAEEPTINDLGNMKVIPGNDPTIISTYKMATIDETLDEFRGSTRFGGTASEANVRIPLEIEELGLAALYGNNPSDAQIQNLLNVNSEDEAIDLVAEVRGRILGKQGRVLGPILNSNPVIVGPPSLDLPIASYRDFKDKYKNRATMLYTSTLDGLLHAIHTGAHNSTEDAIVRRDFNGTDTSNTGEVNDGSLVMREAWAYAPEMIRRDYANNIGRQPNLLDGTPVIQDVRLCHGEPDLNQNPHACKAAENGSFVPPQDQWRTVLVQGRGSAGSGYLAMDVTNSGGLIEGAGNRMPDPIPLWEFDWRWEGRQILALRDAGLESRFSYSPDGPTPSDISSDSNCDGDGSLFDIFFTRNTLDEFPYIGLSVGEPAIGTVVLDNIGPDSTRRIQRPVAIFTAGQNGDIPESSACRLSERRGRAIYVVDLQTGTLLRRFLDYYPIGDSQAYAFETAVTGTPVTYSARPGTVTTRAFVGDAAGRLFRLNLSDPNPANWRVDLFFDPCEDDDLKNQAGLTCDRLEGNTLADRPRSWGPASFKPAVALDPQRNLTIVYGLGERTDTSVSDQTQAMIALRERININEVPDKIWATTFPEDPVTSVIREKLTGPPVIFNYGIYFTTYTEEVANICAPGLSRVWGLRMIDDGQPGLDGVLDFRASAGGISSDDIKFSNDAENELVRWYEPQLPTLIRGVTIAFPPSCDEDISDPNNPQSTAGAGATAAPELIATTGSAQVAGETGTAGNSNQGRLYSDAIGKINASRTSLTQAPEPLKPLSWAILGD